MADEVPDRAVAADPAPDQPPAVIVLRDDNPDMECVVVLNGSITADWDTAPWRGEGTSRFIGGFGPHTY